MAQAYVRNGDKERAIESMKQFCGGMAAQYSQYNSTSPEALNDAYVGYWEMANLMLMYGIFNKEAWDYAVKALDVSQDMLNKYPNEALSHFLFVRAFVLILKHDFDYNSKNDWAFKRAENCINFIANNEPSMLQEGSAIIAIYKELADKAKRAYYDKKVKEEAELRRQEEENRRKKEEARRQQEEAVRRAKEEEKRRKSEIYANRDYYLNEAVLEKFTIHNNTGYRTSAGFKDVKTGKIVVTGPSYVSTGTMGGKAGERVFYSGEFVGNDKWVTGERLFIKKDREAWIFNKAGEEISKYSSYCIALITHGTKQFNTRRGESIDWYIEEDGTVIHTQYQNLLYKNKFQGEIEYDDKGFLDAKTLKPIPYENSLAIKGYKKQCMLNILAGCIYVLLSYTVLFSSIGIIAMWSILSWWKILIYLTGIIFVKFTIFIIADIEASNDNTWGTNGTRWYLSTALCPVISMSAIYCILTIYPHIGGFWSYFGIVVFTILFLFSTRYTIYEMKRIFDRYKK